MTIERKKVSIEWREDTQTFWPKDETNGQWLTDFNDLTYGDTDNAKKINGLGGKERFTDLKDTPAESIKTFRTGTRMTDKTAKCKGWVTVEKK